jgi:hypothetical protein
MGERQTDYSRLTRSVLFAAGGGILAGLIVGTLNYLVPGLIPQTAVVGSVGVTIGFVFAFLQIRKG